MASRKLDLLFMVDNSSSMAPLQAQLKAQIGTFVDLLVDPATGKLPDLHLAVISSSFGAGAWSNVPQCGSGSHPGDDQGYFQQGPGGAGKGTCTMLHAGATYLSSGDGATAPNYDGDIRDAFTCISALGDTGCGFESQFESTYYALYYAFQEYGDGQREENGKGIPRNTQNGGFLRPDALLAIVMLTNGDDCSVASDSLLFDPTSKSVNHPSGLGAPGRYRCSEFGHLCAGQPPPHLPPTSPVTLNNCVSAEANGKTDVGERDPNGGADPAMGHLWPTVAEFTSYVGGFKANPDDILVAAIAGPPTPYVVGSRMNALGEAEPTVESSCAASSTEPAGAALAAPAVRIKQWIDSFGANGLFYPACAADLRQAMTGIATKLAAKVIVRQCLTSTIVNTPAGEPDCLVKESVVDRTNGMRTTTTLAFCHSTPDVFPCWGLVPVALSEACPTGLEFRICRDIACAPPAAQAIDRRLDIACSIKP